MNPSKLTTPSFLMNFPFTLSTKEPNNKWMEEFREAIDQSVAFQQFLQLYHYLAQKSLIYLLPSEGHFQDQVFVANVGAYLPHIKERNVMLVSNFKSPPRKGEDEIAKKFFQSMGYEVHKPPFHWEGEADLKYIRDNLYIAGYGIRTDLKAHAWLKDHFGMEIVSVEMNDPYLYHFDTICFPISENKVFLTASSLTKKDLSAIERVVDVVEIPKKYRYGDLTGCVRIHNEVLCTNVVAATPEEEKKMTRAELTKNREERFSFFDKLCSKHNLKLKIFDLSEFEKSGGATSCMLMHLNFSNRL